MPNPLQLPTPDAVVFDESPLSLVVCQVRFEHLGEVERHQDSLRDLLADDYPLTQRLQTAELQVSAAGAQAASANGLRFASIEGDWTFTLMPDFASLETTAYDDWASFEVRLRNVMSALAQTAHPRVETRLGLRYVNQIEVPSVSQPSDWTKLLQPAIVGDLSGDAPLAASIITLHQMMQLDIGDGARLTFRHGLPGEAAASNGAGLAYLLDFDCSRQQEMPLDIDSIVAEADRFNTTITSLFQWCLTDELRKELKPRAK
jgi:uncharacterized protein (TIGR04255 family)